MGYCTELSDSTISITKENAKNIMNNLKDYIEKVNPDWRWVSNKYLIDAIEEEEFESVMEEVRYAVYLVDDLYKIDYLAGEKLGDDFEIFKIIAPFVNDGYIEMIGEDGSKWRWVFENGECNEIYPSVEWR